MRIVSLVPSWTETLVQAGLDVVGRTRHCIHPAGAITRIPVVGGTKDWDWDKIRALKPDYLVLDQEENPRFMAEQSEIPWLATHVCSLADVGRGMRQMAQTFSSTALDEMASEWDRISTRPYERDWRKLVEWSREPSGIIKQFIYVIWKDPWMAVSRNTYAGSLLAHCGMPPEIYPSKYPEFDLNAWAEDPSTVLLFSSEPYPFRQKRAGLEALKCPHGFVDGEVFNWFGLRGLRFLEC